MAPRELGRRVPEHPAPGCHRWQLCQSLRVNAVLAKVEGGAIRLEQGANWADGQRVLVIALLADESIATEAPPAELLEEDAQELAPRREVLASVNERELA